MSAEGNTSGALNSWIHLRQHKFGDFISKF